MNSLFIICLPSILGLKIIDHLNPKLKIKDLVIYYLLLVLVSNTLCLCVNMILNNFKENFIIYITEHLDYAFKYLLLSIFLNALSGILFSILIKNFSMTLEVKNDKKVKKNN